MARSAALALAASLKGDGSASFRPAQVFATNCTMASTTAFGSTSACVVVVLVLRVMVLRGVDRCNEVRMRRNVQVACVVRARVCECEASEESK